MSNSQLFIPDKIKVGYQNRQGTYSGKLAYVIYFDNKGVLRKETSWNGWCDKKLGSHEFENVPLEGFVLNKKAGGYDTGWNHRQTYCRVWDPRGFEIEIDIPNLLFILQETSCTKGKGLEGEFVYAWDGKELVLLPAHCQEYKQSQSFTKLQSGKVSTKELTPGCMYLTKRQEQLVYLGKFNWVQRNYNDKYINILEPSYIFMHAKPEKYRDFLQFSSLSSIAQKVTDEPVTDLVDRIEKFAQSEYSCSIKEIKLGSSASLGNVNDYYYGSSRELEPVYLQESDGGYRVYIPTVHYIYEGYSGYGRRNKLEGVTLKSREIVYLKDGILTYKKKPIDDNKKYSEKEFHALGLKNIEITFVQKEKEKTKNLI